MRSPFGYRLGWQVKALASKSIQCAVELRSMCVAPFANVWATRGSSWGFRFLRNCGLVDLLATYEQAFGRTGGERTLFEHYKGVAAPRFLTFLSAVMSRVERSRDAVILESTLNSTTGFRAVGRN